MDKHKVTVFSTQTCPWCVRAKQYLDQHKIEYKDMDVSTDQDSAAIMVKRSGEMGVPQLWIDDEVVVGFDMEKINQLLGL